MFFFLLFLMFCFIGVPCFLFLSLGLFRDFLWLFDIFHVLSTVSHMSTGRKLVFNRLLLYSTRFVGVFGQFYTHFLYSTRLCIPSLFFIIFPYFSKFFIVFPYFPYFS